MLKAIVLFAFLAVAAAYPIDFALDFIGYVSPNKTGVSRGKAGSQQITTLIDNQYGVFTQEKRFVGPNAVWLSDFDRTKPSEKGNITFGAAFPNAQVHVLTVELVSYTYVDTLPDGLQRSGFVFNVTGGAGAFVGSRGVLVGTLLLNVTSSEYYAKTVSSIWNPNAPPPPPAEN